MKKKKKEGIRITKRDERLFKYLYENKLANQKQINRDLFKSIARTTVGRRINKLIRKKLLVMNFLEGINGCYRTYSITEKAFKLYLGGEFDDAYREQFQSNYPHHDLDLVDIRSVLLKREDIKLYISENILQSGMELPEKDYFSLIKHNPDAVLKVDVQGDIFTFFLEYESSMKSMLRYESFLRKYYFDKKVEAVFFIYKDKKIFDKILSLEKNIFSHRRPRLFYCSLDEILSTKDKITFVNFQNSKISLT